MRGAHRVVLAAWTTTTTLQSPRSVVLSRHLATTRIMSSSSSIKSSVPKDTYCHAAQGHEFHGPYHDEEYGFPIRGNDNALLERLLLEINQAGLSWLIVLKKRPGFVEAYDGCDINTVAAYTDKDQERLRNDDRVIRNKLKIKAAIYNAQRILELQRSHGSFEAWLDAHHPRSKPDWVKLFKKSFKFTGGEVTGEFLVSLGYLPGAHHKNCPVANVISKLNPPWMSAPENFVWYQ